MKAHTSAVTIEAPAADVLEFVANPATLPQWAVGFAHAIRREGDRWIASTARGEVGVRYAVDLALGTVDFYLAPEPGVEFPAFSRVLPNADGAEYVFTQFQSPGMSDHEFQGQVEALHEELQVLRSLFRARASCATR
jgi:hypothetical protein